MSLLNVLEAYIPPPLPWYRSRTERPQAAKVSISCFQNNESNFWVFKLSSECYRCAGWKAGDRVEFRFNGRDGILMHSENGLKVSKQRTVSCNKVAKQMNFEIGNYKALVIEGVVFFDLNEKIVKEEKKKPKIRLKSFQIGNNRSWCMVFGKQCLLESGLGDGDHVNFSVKAGALTVRKDPHGYPIEKNFVRCSELAKELGLVERVHEVEVVDGEIKFKYAKEMESDL